LSNCLLEKDTSYQTILDVQGIPDKGKLLTQISLFWFNKLADIIPNHFVTENVDEMPIEVHKYKDQLEGRSMLVRKAGVVVPLEAIVRGYITGTPAPKFYHRSRMEGNGLF